MPLHSCYSWSLGSCLRELVQGPRSHVVRSTTRHSFLAPPAHTWRVGCRHLGGLLATRACNWNYCCLLQDGRLLHALAIHWNYYYWLRDDRLLQIGGEHKDACIQAHALCLLLSPFAAWAPVCEARLLVGVAEAAGVRRTARRDAALARVGGIAADHALEAARARRAGAVRSRGARNLGLARSPASIRWRFHRSPRCTAASALLQPLSSPSALGRRRARSTRASPASLRWRFHRFARFRAASALPQPLPSSSALVGRRRARSTRALPASLPWRFHRCARCRAACALPQPLSSPSAFGRRRARSLDASVASFVTLAYSTALRGLGLQVHCCSRCLRRRL